MNNISNEKIFRGKIGNICLIEIDKYDFIIPKSFILIKNSREHAININDEIDNKETYNFLINDSNKIGIIGKFVNESPFLDEDFPTYNIFANCNKSGLLLDKIYRDEFMKIDYNRYKIISVKAIAGSGKTTLLLNFAKEMNHKKILYLAFNKSIVEETMKKTKSLGMKNIIAKTFDSLLYQLCKNKFGDIQINDLFFEINNHNHYKKLNYISKKKVVSIFTDFCTNIYKNTIEENNIIYPLWKECLLGNIITFESIRKMAYLERWCKDYIDKNFDFILIDEAQDFDPMMLEMLLNDTTIPRIFVGDPNQAIYQFRGAINSFERLPNNEESLHIQLYTSNRIGYPACTYIGEKTNTIIIPINENKITEIFFEKQPSEESYVYLFRNWKNLIIEAQSLKDIYIFDFEKKMTKMKELQEKLKKNPNMETNRIKDEFEDELPSFLLSMSIYELSNIEKRIMANIVLYEDSKIKLYTIHSYKGCEDDNVRIYNDIDNIKEPNLYYVALTRGKKNIFLDNKKNIIQKYNNKNIPDHKITNFFQKIL
jgi:hypothetical protein